MSPLSVAREDYLKAIYQLGGASHPVQTGEIAARLDVRRPSVTAMVRCLAEEGLVEHESRQGVTLSETGLAAVLHVVRRHRLLETFLVEVLGLDWSEVHEEAEVLEHHLSERMVDAIDRVLEHPSFDPHGHPIPDARGRLRQRSLRPLAELATGESGVVREVRANDAERLQRWKELGLVPGAELRMGERLDMEDVMHVDLGSRTIVTGTEGVDGVLVEVKE